MWIHRFFTYDISVSGIISKFLCLLLRQLKTVTFVYLLGKKVQTHIYHQRPDIITYILVEQMKTEKELKPNMKNPYILYTFIFIHVDL